MTDSIELIPSSLPAPVGTPRWSVPLPAGSVSAIATAQGWSFVTAEQHLLAIDPTGRMVWTATAPIMLYPLALDNGMLLVYDGAGLTLRVQATGAIVTHIPTTAATMAVATPTGDLVFGDHTEDGRRAVLRCVHADGSPFWSHPLAGSVLGAPMVCDQHVVVSDGSTLRTCTLDGELAWSVAAADVPYLPLTDGIAVAAADVTPSTIDLPPVRVGPRSVLVHVEHDDGYGWAVADVQAQTLRPLGAHLPSGVPLAVAPISAAGQQIVTLDWPVKDAADAWRSAVLAVDFTGQPRWTHQTTARPVAIVADARGYSFIVCSPAPDYWVKYRSWYHLDADCFIRCLTPDGVEVYTWHATGPIAPVLAIGDAGIVYAVADGRLWAIA